MKQKASFDKINKTNELLSKIAKSWREDLFQSN